MSRRLQRLYERIRLGNTENVRFEDFLRLVEAFGFAFSHQKASLVYYRHPAPPAERLTLQPRKNGDAKDYQISQFLELIDRYKLEAE